MPFFALCSICRFLSTPSGWRATLAVDVADTYTVQFLSTPSGWRATMFFLGIKISASYFYPRPPGGGRPSASKLIVEKSINFYPRPPGGGRHWNVSAALGCGKFLSTPSGWRATGIINLIFMRPPQFLSTPSGWRATGRRIDLRKPRRAFLSTPSGWRATRDDYIYRCIVGISIHALRVEGDQHLSAIF